MAFNPTQFRRAVDEVLHKLDLHSLSAVNLILGTIAKESDFGTYLRQVGGGPARGVIQMEPATERDHWYSYLHYRKKFSKKLEIITGVGAPNPLMLELNLAYQIAICRVHYLRVPDPLPDADDIEGLAAYYKKYYNTVLGKGTEDEFIRSYAKYLG